MVDNWLLSSASCSGVNVTGSVGRPIANYAPGYAGIASEQLTGEVKSLTRRPHCGICRRLLACENPMGKTPRKFIVAALSISALFSSDGCGGSKITTVRIGYLSNTGSLPLFVAE